MTGTAITLPLLPMLLYLRYMLNKITKYINL